MTGRHPRAIQSTATTSWLLAAAFGVAAVITVVGLAIGAPAVITVGLALAVAAAASLAAYLIFAERRRHEAAELELTSEARFLESLVDSMAAIAGADDVLIETRAQAAQLCEARPELLRPGERPTRAPAASGMVMPLPG